MQGKEEKGRVKHYLRKRSNGRENLERKRNRKEEEEWMKEKKKKVEREQQWKRAWQTNWERHTMVFSWHY